MKHSYVLTAKITPGVNDSLYFWHALTGVRQFSIKHNFFCLIMASTKLMYYEYVPQSNIRSHRWWVFSKDNPKVVLFTILCFKSLVKERCVVKVLVAISDTFLYENTGCFYIRSYKFTFKPFFAFCRNQNQNSYSEEASGLVMKNIFFFFVYSELRSTSKACKFQTYNLNSYAKTSALFVMNNCFRFRWEYSREKTYSQNGLPAAAKWFVPTET